MQEGDIVKIYKEWNNPKKFDCWAQLVKRDYAETEVYLTDKYGHEVIGYPPFVYEEVQHLKPNFPDVEDAVWYGKKKCFVSKVDERSDEIWVCLPNGSVDKLQYPFPIQICYEPKHYEISYDGDYLGYVQLVRDKLNHIHIRDTEGNFRKLKKNLLEVKTHKYEPRTILWTGQRWKVKLLTPAWPSDLLNRRVWFKDEGKCEEVEYKDGLYHFCIGDKEYKEKFISDNFWATRGNEVTHRNVSFYLTTDGAYSSYSSEWDRGIWKDKQKGE